MLSCARCHGTLRPGVPFCPHCGAMAPDTPAGDPLIGQVLARKFRVQSMLGEGGMGRVYRAEQLPLGVDVVVKTLHPQLATDPTVVTRFFREAQAASKLRHPNCISILDFGDDDGVLYIAMEYLRGRSLARVIQQDGRFEPKRTLRIITQVLDVLTAAHRMEIVHRDLKPENIMVEDLATHRDFVKVLDFGIAKITAAGNEKLTRTGMVFGTPSYMAPEQAASLEVDGRADLYAVGVIMFELLTGRLPFQADTLPMLIMEVATKPAPPVLTLRGDLPPQLAAIIDSLLAKDPADRPQSALDLKAALEQVDLAAPAPAVAVAQAPAVVRELPAAQIQCPRCGHPLAATAKFCGECGTQLGRGSGELKDKLGDLRRLLPTGIIDELSQLKARNAGEKREIVALVVDITGAPADGEGGLAELHDQLAELAVRHTGSLERRPGAGTVIAFGLAMVHADEAERAIEAALAARELVKSHNAQHGLALEMTCVIHGGPVIVEGGARGSAYAPVGNTIELPVRLSGAIAADKIVVTEHVQRLVRTSVELKQLPSARIKGQASPVPIFEVTSTNIATRTPLVALARPSFAGRGDAVRALVAALDDSGKGQTLHLTGEPGIGKSRLLEETARAVAGKPWTIIQSTVRPGPDRQSPLVADVVASLGGSVDALRSLGLELEEIRLLSPYLEDAQSVPQVGDERVRDAAIASTLRTALELRAQLSPVCLFVDDVHLADRRSGGVLARLVAEPAPRVSVVTAARAGHPLPWESVEGAVVRTATLGKLTDQAIEQIVEAALRPTPAQRELKEAVASRAGGSPLMALEVLRQMIDEGVLVSIGERWSVLGELSSVARPAGLRALYAARLDALPAYARDVLSCAAVAGDEVAIDVLQRVVARTQGAPIEREIRLLVARGLLTEAQPEALRFAEPSAREVVYGRLAKETRRELHAAIASALEARFAAAPVPEEVIGEHYELGGDASRALEWYAKAAATATDARELRRAIQILGRARTACRTVATAAANRRLAEDSLRLGELLLELGELVELRGVIAEGLASAHKDDDANLIARIRRLRGRAALATSQLDAAITDLDAALAGAVGLRDRVMIAELHGDLGEAYERKGDLTRAIDYLLRALELVQTAPGDTRAAVLRLLTAVGRVVLRNKEIDRAERFLAQALELAQQLDDKHGAAKVLGNLAGAWHARGDYAKAIELSTRALALSREVGDLVSIARQLTNLGTLCSLSGDVTGALRNYDAAFAQAQRAGWREGMATAAAGRERLSSAGTRAR